MNFLEEWDVGLSIAEPIFVTKKKQERFSQLYPNPNWREHARKIRFRSL